MKILVIALQILVGLEYAAIFVWGMSETSGRGSVNSVNAQLCLATMALAIFGVSGLHYALRNLKQRDVAWLGLLIAVGIAPLAAIVEMIIGGTLLRGVRVPIARILIPSAVIGFYVPFVIVALILKYKYRTDEF